MRVAKVIVGDIETLTGGYLYEKKLVDYLRQSGIQADVVSIPRMPGVLQFFSSVYLLVHFRGKHYDVVIEDEMAHAALWLFNLWAKRMSSLKLVALVHMFSWVASPARWHASLLKLTEKRMLAACDLIVANSKHTKQVAETMGLSTDAIVVVYPGFDADLITSQEPHQKEDIRLLFVGNLDPRKGLDTLIEAMHQVNDPHLVLDVVGDGTLRSSYARMVKRRVVDHGLEARVRFHGRIRRESIGTFYSQADVFVLPSSYEPFGIVFAEAMAFALPIIATNSGGIPELVRHGHNGLLVPPKDAGALAEAIAKVSSSHELRNAMGTAGRELSKGLNTWDDCFRLIHSYVERLATEDH